MRAYIVIDGENYWRLDDCWLVILTDDGETMLQEEAFFSDDLDSTVDIRLNKALKPEYNI